MNGVIQHEAKEVANHPVVVEERLVPMGPAFDEVHGGDFEADGFHFNVALALPCCRGLMITRKRTPIKYNICTGWIFPGEVVMPRSFVANREALQTIPVRLRRWQHLGFEWR